MLAQKEQDHWMGTASGSTADIPLLCRRRRKRAGVWRTEPFGPTKKRRRKKSHFCGRLGSGGERDAEEPLSRNIQEYHEEGRSRTMDNRPCPSGLLEGLVHRGTGQIADVRRPLVSASHIIHAGNDLFIGKNEAYIMNRKKKEKSVLRKEGNVYVLELVREGAMRRSRAKQRQAHGGRRNQSSCRRKRAKEASHVRLQQPNVEDRCKRTATVRPQFGERCENRRERDGALGATSDENDIELNGETDDEDMEDGETGFDDWSAQVRNIRDRGQPTVKEHQEHKTTHRPCRSRCEFCVMGRDVNAPHRRSNAQDDLEEVPHVSMDYGFFGEWESEEQSVSCAVHPVNGDTR